MAALAIAGSAEGAMAQTRSDDVAVSGLEVVGARTGGLNLAAATDGGSRLGLTPLETPASIELLTGATVRARGDLSVADAVSRATGIVQQSDPGNGATATFAARGFSGTGSVMTLFDGMRMFVGAGTITFPFDPWTIDQVEVLRGPASVLYGQGAIGGAVNIKPRRPDPMMHTTEFQLGVGSDSTYRAAVGAGGPINSVLSYRADVSRIASDGYVDRGGSDSWALSGSLRFQPRKDLNFILSHDFGDQEPMRYFGTPLIDGRIDDRTKSLNYNVSDAAMRFKDNWTQLRAEWTPSEQISVRNALFRLDSNRLWRNAEIYTYDPASQSVERTSYTPIIHDQNQWGDTADVTFRNDIGGLANTLLVGAEFNRVKFVHTNDGFPETTTVVDAFRPDPGVFIEAGAFVPRYRTRTRQYGFFAEDQLKLTPQLSVVGGLRYDNYHVRRTDLIRNAQVVDKTLENTSWRVGVVYAPTPALSFYGQFATGADPLGSLITTSAGQVPFDLSTGRQWEAGVKALFLGGRGEATFAAFHVVKEKLLTRDRQNPNLQQQVGQRSAKGLEASVSVQLGGGWAIDANGTILDAEYDDFSELVGETAISRNGMTPPNTPEKSANLWLSWTPIEQLKFYGGVRYVGRQYGDNAESANLVLPSYTVVDAGAEWRFTRDLALNVQLFNGFDEVYGQTAYGDQQWILGRPRSFEVRLSGRF
jgi:iron complex outermembrane receptor protein